MFGIFRSRDPRRTLRRALGDYALPSFPAVAAQALEHLRRESASAASVAEVLALDPGLSVKILATVNSAAYSPRRRVANLTQAVAMLGMSNVESLVLAVAVGSSLPVVSCPGFDARRFWRAAARRAAAAQALAGLIEPARRSESFTAALLQDMAVPLLAASRPAVYGPVLERWHAGQGELVALERAELGVDHAEAAVWLCGAWKLPEALAGAIGHHHAPAGSEPACPAAVALVSHLRETDDRTGAEDLVAAAGEGFGLSRDAVVPLLDASFEEAEELAALFA